MIRKLTTSHIYFLISLVVNTSFLGLIYYEVLYRHSKTPINTGIMLLFLLDIFIAVGGWGLLKTNRRDTFVRLGFIISVTAVVFISLVGLFQPLHPAYGSSFNIDFLNLREAIPGANTLGAYLVEQGTSFLANEIIVLFTREATLQDMQGAANVVGGRITAILDFAKIVKIEVGTTNLADLGVLVNRLKASGNSKIIEVLPNFLMEVF